MQALKGWRTYIVSVLTMVIAIAGFIVHVADNLGPIDANATGAVLIMSILFAIMRTMTTTPPGKQAPVAPVVPIAVLPPPIVSVPPSITPLPSIVPPTPPAPPV